MNWWSSIYLDHKIDPYLRLPASTRKERGWKLKNETKDTENQRTFTFYTHTHNKYILGVCSHEYAMQRRRLPRY